MRQFKRRKRGENVQVIQQSMVMHHSSGTCSPLGGGVGPGIEMGIVKLYSSFDFNNGPAVQWNSRCFASRQICIYLTMWVVRQSLII